ncbi:MAG: D-alanyl-D-alanine carboxypeptidase [Chitinophagaceae bacterium]|nr:D-alanyl-D-alanine carboxypeptidase [Chitinophagaceae bacterium]
MRSSEVKVKVKVKRLRSEEVKKLRNEDDVNDENIKSMKFFYYLFFLSYFVFLSSCSVSNQLAKSAKILISDSALQSAHTGISIYEPATNKFWYKYQAEKYFLPASNTKLFTLYAGMKYLGDSLTGLKVTEYDDRIIITPTGDPTLLHPDFKQHPVYEFLQNAKKDLYSGKDSWNEKAWGPGWAWDDYNDDYQAERSVFPVYGNVVRFSGTKTNMHYYPTGAVTFDTPGFSQTGTGQSLSPVVRQVSQNIFKIDINGNDSINVDVPFITSASLGFKLLEDRLHKKIIPGNSAPGSKPAHESIQYSIHSQPSDSLFKIMMYRSDNFYAEQTLLMVSNERLGYMNDKNIIDTLLKTDLKKIPQQPQWVDGSGLSRYNLFTPNDLVYIINKLKNDFGLARLEVILPTGGTGTLATYYKKDSGFIFAKTGSLSNNIALSGFLITRKNKLLIFSVMVNNFNSTPASVRRSVEKFITLLRQNW